MPFTVNERKDIVKWYYESFNSKKVGYHDVELVKHKFQRKYHLGPPCRNAIMKMVNKFELTGTTENLHKFKCGRPRTARSPRNINIVQQAVTRYSKKSTRRHAKELDPPISKSSIHRILRLDLHLYPYRIHMAQKLSDIDKERRLAYSQHLLNIIQQNPQWLNNVWWTDESHILLSGHVNRKNLIFWGSQKPEEVFQVPLFSRRITVWCAVNANRIIGPYFFEEHGETVTVNTERYKNMLQNFFVPALRNNLLTVFDVQWFHQDAAPPQRNTYVKFFLTGCCQKVVMLAIPPVLPI